MIRAIEKNKNLLSAKSQWEKVRLIDVCEIDPSKRELNGIDKNSEVSFGMMADLGEHKRKFSPTEIKKVCEVTKGGYSYFKENDVLLAKMTPCFENGKSGIALNLKNGIGFGSTEFYVLRSNGKILSDWIYFIISSEKFLEEGKHSLVGTTGRRRLIKHYVESFQVPLPTLSEQTQITELFQSIEISLEQAGQQEADLKELRESLINKLTKVTPKLGKLITSKCKTVNVGEVAEEISARIDNPSQSEYEKFVGLEDFETGELRINKYSTTENLVSAMKLFRSGDVLFARRNVYLKRVSQAVFDGVCSGDAIVMRVNQKIIFPEFLTLILNTNEFWDYALSNAAGAFSKRIKWRELAVYSFDLPDIKTQEKILEVFQQIEKTLLQLKTQKQTLKNLKQKLLNEILG